MFPISLSLNFINFKQVLNNKNLDNVVFAIYVITPF